MYFYQSFERTTDMHGETRFDIRKLKNLHINFISLISSTFLHAGLIGLIDHLLKIKVINLYIPLLSK